jgi:CRP-like cAMP-binding protein
METTNPIIHLFRSLGPVSEGAIKEFEAIMKFEVVPKNTDLLEIGKRAKYMFFISKGLARAYYYHDGKDVTDYFAIDGQFIGAVPSLMTGLPSEKGIHLIEQSEIYSWLSSDFEAICARHHDFEHISRVILGYALMEEQERIESLRFYSVSQRYALMEKKYPGIMNRCPLHYVASYLGTTQVSISRIRAGVQ